MRKGYGFSGLMVRKDLVDSGRFKTYKDLKGMKLAVGTFGSANSSAMNEALKKGGLKWSDAGEIVALTFPQHIVAFQNKAIDASMTNEPTVDRGGAATASRCASPATTRSIRSSRPRSCSIRRSSRARGRSIALKFMRAYIRAVREYNDALKDGRIAGPNADEVISILTEYTFIKDANIHRSITPAAIDPDGRLSLAGLRNDLVFFKEQKLIAGPRHDGRAHHRHVVRRKGRQELGPYKPRG